MSAEPQIRSVDDFLNFYMDNPIPLWLYPFDGNISGITVNIQKINEQECYIIPNYDTNNWREKFKHALPVPYIKGKIACVETGKDLWGISSKFSGCIMASFYFNSDPNKRYVCHIAKGDVLCKDENVTAFMNCTEITRLCAFDPYEMINLHELEQALKDNPIIDWKQHVYGIVTDANECYSFVIGSKNQEVWNIMFWAKWEIVHEMHQKKIKTSNDDESECPTNQREISS